MSNWHLRPFFVFEMANNHMGSVEHGLRIVEAMHEVSREFPFHFGVKLQYRDLDTFIHADYKNRSDLKFVKRFSETRLKWEDFKRLKDAIVEKGFLAICTPFDEKSVDRIEEHGFDVLKIASCSITDWPLLERIAKTNLPLIGSTGGVSLLDIDHVVSFFRHRDKDFALMHCVAQYPTPPEDLELNQIALLKARYQGLEVGYSTHEHPDNVDAVKIAIGMGTRLFEKHVGLPTDRIQLNAYSASPAQVRAWLQAAALAFSSCGVEGQRRGFSASETASLRSLQRGVFAATALKAGEKLQAPNTFYAMPSGEGQVVANDISKYADFCLTTDLEASAPVMFSALRTGDRRKEVYAIVADVKKFLKRSRVAIPGQLELEISHHYGLEQFRELGCVMITVVNRDYCKKIIALLPGQAHPEQYHKQKDETYHILYGEMVLMLNGEQRNYKSNDVVFIPRGSRHAFSSRTGAVIEEISTSHIVADSFYIDSAINANRDRKTFVTYWMD
jgi:sialic acid synthase SpsE/mannose-6-phosphate isomerase-like protein (cupin superfamily)